MRVLIVLLCLSVGILAVKEVSLSGDESALKEVVWSDLKKSPNKEMMWHLSPFDRDAFRASSLPKELEHQGYAFKLDGPYLYVYPKANERAAHQQSALY